MRSELGGFDFSRKGFAGLFALYTSLEDQRKKLYLQMLNYNISKPDRNAPEVVKEIQKIADEGTDNMQML